MAGALGLGPVELVVAIGHDALGEGDENGPPLVQSAPKRPRLMAALSEAALAGLWPGAARTAYLAVGSAVELTGVLRYTGPSH